jgi:hypothetical protein
MTEAPMRIVVRNVAKQPLAFDALKALEPDIALLNEASPPTSASGIWRSATEGATERVGCGRPLSPVFDDPRYR